MRVHLSVLRSGGGIVVRNFGLGTCGSACGCLYETDAMNLATDRGEERWLPFNSSICNPRENSGLGRESLSIIRGTSIPHSASS